MIRAIHLQEWSPWEHDRREEAPRREDQPARRVASTGPVDAIAPADEVAVEIARLPAPGTQIDVLA